MVHKPNTSVSWMEEEQIDGKDRKTDERTQNQVFLIVRAPDPFSVFRELFRQISNVYLAKHSIHLNFLFH